MGISSDGLLWWGVAFDDEDDEQIDEAINYPNGEGYGDGREWLAEHNLTGVQFVMHCSYDYTMYGIAAAGTEVTAWRGSPKFLGDLGPQTPGDVAKEQVLAVVKALGRDPEKVQVGWHLASMYG